MTCCQKRVARKYQLNGFARLAAMVNFHLARSQFNLNKFNGAHIPLNAPAVKKVCPPRRALPVLFISENPQEIKIGHDGPKLDNAIKKIPVQPRQRI